MNRVVTVFALSLLSTAALAQSAPAQKSGDDARFQIERQGSEIIRLDRQTGALSICSQQGTQLDCRMSADERAALQTEIDRLSAELDALKGKGGAVESDGKSVTLKLPTEQELQTMMGYIEDAFRKIVDAVVGLAQKA